MIKSTAKLHTDPKAVGKLRLWALAALLLVVFVASFFLGRYGVSLTLGQFLGLMAEGLQRVLTSIINGVGKLFGFSIDRLFTVPVTWPAVMETIVFNIRMPRIIMACLVGCCLASAGACYQGVFQNPMAAPDLLGASTGGAALAILHGRSSAMITLYAFSFSLLTVLLVFVIGQRAPGQKTVNLILAGIMISSLFSAGTSYIKLVADPGSKLPEITYWLMGSLTSIKARDVQFAVLPILVGLIPLWLLRWRVNLLTVSEAEARSMGVDTTRLRVVVVLCATLMTAGSVAISGMIGWVGLVIPHFGRMIFGQDYRRLLPASSLLGATFLMVVDNLARTITTSEIPLGILTSFVGAPVFLYLILSGGTQRGD